MGRAAYSDHRPTIVNSELDRPLRKLGNIMLKAWTYAESLLDPESGASLVEYAMLVALIALVAIAALQTVGNNVSDEFNDIADCVENPGACP